MFTTTHNKPDEQPAEPAAKADSSAPTHIWQRVVFLGLWNSALAEPIIYHGKIRRSCHIIFILHVMLHRQKAIPYLYTCLRNLNIIFCLYIMLLHTTDCKTM